MLPSRKELEYKQIMHYEGGREEIAKGCVRGHHELFVQVAFFTVGECLLQLFNVCLEVLLLQLSAAVQVGVKDGFVNEHILGL